VNVEKIKYMFMSHHQNARQNHDIKIANKCFENVAEFRYSGTTVTDRNMVQEEIERRLNHKHSHCKTESDCRWVFIYTK
jgi:hypothetical protein